MKLLVGLLSVFGTGTLLAGCGGGAPQSGGIAPPHIERTFAPHLDHPFLPDPAFVSVFDGVKDGAPVREEVWVLRESRQIAGIACTGIHEQIYVDGELAEVTTEWIAQDTSGHVWKFGEESFESDDGVMEPSEDSWLADEGEHLPWIVFPRDPFVGQIVAGSSPEGLESYHVVGLDEVAVTPAGIFPGSMQVVENPDDPEDRDVILYAQGVGKVSEQSADGGIVLASREPRTTAWPID